MEPVNFGAQINNEIIIRYDPFGYPHCQKVARLRKI